MLMIALIELVRLALIWVLELIYMLMIALNELVRRALIRAMFALIVVNSMNSNRLYKSLLGERVNYVLNNSDWV